MYYRQITLNYLVFTDSLVHMGIIVKSDRFFFWRELFHFTVTVKFFKNEAAEEEKAATAAGAIFS